ncbi:DUF5689 domain-containing protein [Pedobacter sp. PLR]|uniref:DUF5689 domain-containing protein n=1 Tax=Pedobacter sp. PLR TaxID=2994465 RepID=UPI00224698C4|nr:DUF5689 domain-containing protein [Pedobacter sp. PLR]MCX2449642.1 DUF5689 domain-containing protein [Pedobacter sp. PLR]
MKKIHPAYPVISSMLLIFLFSMVSCKKDNKPIRKPGLPPIVNQISIASIKALSTEQSVKIKDEGVIRGVVISDASSKNVVNNKTLFLQEGSGKSGIMVKLQADHKFKLNDSLEIKILGQTVTTLNETVVLQDLANNLVKKLGVGKIIPRETSVRELEANKKDWEGSLIRISAGKLISDNGNYSGNMKISDGKATLASYIIEDAVFNGQGLPQDIMSIVGIVHLNGSKLQLAPRNTSDILPLKYIRDEFTTWRYTTWTYNLVMERYALLTELANWSGDTKDGTIKQLVNPADAVFTKSGKIYPYLPKDSLASKLQLYSSDKLSLKGLKVLKITFAASKSTGDIRFIEQSVGYEEIAINVLPFNTGTDVVNIGVEIPIESTGELIPGKLVTPKGFEDYYRVALLTPPIKETGKFYNAIFIIPSNMEDLKAMGITSINRQKWLDNPAIRIINLSSRKTAGITTRNRDRYIPILIDKVEMGFQ